MADHSGRYINVAPAVPLSPTSPQIYTYHVKGSLAKQTKRFAQVSIPFGNKLITGVVVSFGRRPAGNINFDPSVRLKNPTVLTKSPASVMPLSLTRRQIEFAQWISATMYGGLGFTFRLFFPRGKTGPSESRENREPEIIETEFNQKEAVSLLQKTLRKPGVIIEKDQVNRVKIIGNIAAEVVKHNGQVLILVPEKALIDKTIKELQRLLPKELISYHGALSSAQELNVWQMIKGGKPGVIVGTQKALFLPWQALKLVVVEEEFFPSHKLGEQYPRLDNRYAAKKLAEIHACPIFFAGSISSLHLAAKLNSGEYVSIKDYPLTIKTKVIGHTFNDHQQHNFFPSEAIVQIRQWLRAGENVFMLHNQRGHWAAAVCSKCHFVRRCSQCGTTMSLYGKNALRCLRCNIWRRLPAACPQCKKKTLRRVSAGTQHVAEIARQIFTKTSVVRIDADSIADKDEASWRKIVASPSLIVGTLAALRVLSYGGVDRAVFINPERLMLYPDFRSEEHTLYLLARLQQLLPANRKVVVLTHQQRLIAERLVAPAPRIIKEQLIDRQRLGYPPYQDMVRLTVNASSKIKAEAKAKTIRSLLDEKKSAEVNIQGPYEGFIKRRRGKAEMHLLLLGELKKMAPLYKNLAVNVVDLAPDKVL